MITSLSWKRILVVSLLFAIVTGCAPSQDDTSITELPLIVTEAVPTTNVPTNTIEPTATTITSPKMTLKQGDMYFSVDGVPTFIFSRNLAGFKPDQYEQLLAFTKNGGSKFVRIQLGSMGEGYSNTGELDETWAREWDQVFDQATANGIYIIPVFGVWADWNDDDPSFSAWDSNPLNIANGGPVESPSELFQKDSASQQLWFQWMTTLVERWQERENIVAWEVFSELNIATGTTEVTGIEFIEKAAAIIRQIDTYHRPITASQAGLMRWKGWWPDFYHSSAIDFTSVHLYPRSGQLDTEVIQQVRWMLEEFNKPVLIGESGLSSAAPDSEAGKLTLAENAPRGVKHAVWAGMVSGAMNGRALWWEDGYGIYFKSLSWPFLEKNADIELAAFSFIRDVDVTNFKPLTSQFQGEITGAALGNEQMVIGWYRDAGSEPPDWPLRPIVSNQHVTVTVPGTAENWEVIFYDTQTGVDILNSAMVTRQGDTVTITLPDFTDDIAFKMYTQK